jgi:hypothetical protein
MPRAFMPRSAAPAAALALILIALAGCASPLDSMKRAFGSLRDAIVAGDGAEASRWVDSGTLAFYEARREDALILPEARLRALPLGKKIAVLKVRSAFTADELGAMDGKALLEAALERGWHGDSSMALLELGGEASIDGDKATAGVTMEGRETGQSYAFAREGGEWKVDLIGSGGSSDRILAMVAKENLMTEDQYAEYMLASSGFRVTPDLWKPLAPSGK